jgi:hypothetical protein
MGYDDLKMCAGVDSLERNLVVFWFISPSPRLISPDNAATLNPAPIGPDKTIDGSRIGKEENVVSYQGDLHHFRIAVLNRCNRSSANRFGLKQRRRRDKRSARRPGNQQNSPESFYPIHRSPPPTAEVVPAFVLREFEWPTRRVPLNARPSLQASAKRLSCRIDR